MSKVIILQHVPHEGPGRLVPVFRDYGIPTEIRRLDRGDEVPADLADIRALVVMGGPMGVADVGSSKYPFLAKEVELLKMLVHHDRPVLGICLGAQLLAHAGGAKVYAGGDNAPASDVPSQSSKAGDAAQASSSAAGATVPAAPVTSTAPANPAQSPAPAPKPVWKPEIGWGPVTFPFPGGTEPLVMGMVDGAPMFHWHFDTFDLPKLPPPASAPPGPPPPTGSVLMSSTKHCKNQAFRFKSRLFGFQYHFEMDEAGIEAMLTNDAASVMKVLGPGGADQIRQDTRKYYARYARLGDRILNNYVQFLKMY